VEAIVFQSVTTFWACSVLREIAARQMKKTSDLARFITGLPSIDLQTKGSIGCSASLQPTSIGSIYRSNLVDNPHDLAGHPVPAVDTLIGQVQKLRILDRDLGSKPGTVVFPAC